MILKGLWAHAFFWLLIVVLPLFAAALFIFTLSIISIGCAIGIQGALANRYLAAPGGAQIVSCPLTVDHGSIVVKASPRWRASATLALLESAGVYGGRPEGLALLVPSSTKRIKNGAVDVWKFDAGEEQWLWCGYAQRQFSLQGE